jgi:hypothetical protein
MKTGEKIGKDVGIQAGLYRDIDVGNHARIGASASLITVYIKRLYRLTN